jgi:hypothetical protein
MPISQPPSVTPWPTPPTRQDAASFSERMDVYLENFGPKQVEAAALAANVYANAVDCFQSATGAAANLAAAAVAADSANVAAQTATQAAGAAKWVPRVYADGDVAWDPVTRFSYRRRGAGNSITSPSTDTANWTLAAPNKLPLIRVLTTSRQMSVGGLYQIENAGLTTLTMPLAPQDGDVVGVIVANARFDNVLERNGQLLQGLAEYMTLGNSNASLALQFGGPVVGWRLISLTFI